MPLTSVPNPYYEELKAKIDAQATLSVALIRKKKES